MPVTITHSTLADGTFSATGAAAWDATHTVSGLGTMAEQNANNVNITGGSITGVTGVLSSLTVNSTPTSGGAAGQIMFDTGSVLQESSNLVWDNTAKRLTLTGYSLTGTSALSQLDLSGTWNTTGTPTAIKLNITDTASNAASLLMDLQVGGASKFSFRKDSYIYGDGVNPYVLLSNTTGAQIGYGSSSSGYSVLIGSSRVLLQNNTTQIAQFNASSFILLGDVIFSRRGAANLRFGAADAAAPVAQTLSVQSVVAGTSNTAGANLTITGSQGTGTGAGGDIIFQTAPAGTSGTAQNAFISALKINSNGSISGNAGNTFGIIYVQGNSTTFNDSGLSLDQTGVALRSTGAFSWTSAANGLLANRDTFLTRRGAANLRFGAADAAAPVAQTLSVQSVVAGTSNTAGANLTITGSQGTGTGAGGSIIFQVAPAGGSGTAQNALATLLSLNSDQTITYTYNTTAAGLVVSNATSLGVSSGGSVNIYTTNLPNAADQRLGQFLFGSTGSGTLNSSSITAYSEAAWTAGSSQATYIAFLTTALGSASRAERLRITGSGLLAFGGGGTSSFPALKRSTTILQVRLADDSAYAPVEASTVRTATAYTVATLPAAGTAGRRAYVTDATAPTFLGALIGGGTVVCPVFDDGAAWVAG